jgi:peptidoglycan/xylan/chitin deacetylase (PgdA/CDA1 family)
MMRSLTLHGRYASTPITERPDYCWPGGERLAVYVALGIEAYDFSGGLTEDLVGTGLAHDVLNASWRDYGNRVGAWRVLDALDELALPGTILLNTATYDEAPALAASFRERGCEIVAHGHSNSDTLAGMTEVEEQAYIADVTQAITRNEGRAPEGWASPWIAETPTTPESLQAAGYRYLLDWCMDDQPVWLRTAQGRLLSIPYSQEINDSSTIIGRQASAADFADMIVDQFDEMRDQSDAQPLVMSVILHSFIAGQPFRLRRIKAALQHIATHRGSTWLTQPGQIAAHIHAEPARAC